MVIGEDICGRAKLRTPELFAFPVTVVISVGLKFQIAKCTSWFLWELGSSELCSSVWITSQRKHFLFFLENLASFQLMTFRLRTSVD
jgi:hypothetical protein